MTDSAKSVQQLLNEYKVMLEAEQETEATKLFAKDLGDVAKEYDGIAAIVTKYQAAHDALTESMMSKAKAQRDEVESWCKDKISDPLKEAIKKARGEIDKQETKKLSEKNKANEDFDLCRNELEKAKAKESEALAEFTKVKGFQSLAEDWFADVASLHGAAKGHHDVGSDRLVFAHFLELDAIYTSELVPNFEKDNATPTWLRQELNKQLRALLLIKEARFKAHTKLLTQQKAVADAGAAYKSFVEDGNRRKEFLREALNIDEPPPSSSSTSARTPAPAPA